MTPRPRWDESLRPYDVPAAASEAAFFDLVTRYGEPGRHYHTLAHVTAVLDTLDHFGDAAPDPALRFAAWYHDAVYDPHAGDNEERSADLATTALARLGIPESVIAETVRLILLTKTHATAADDPAGHQLLDADLAVLGSSPAEYGVYAAAIRAEYDWVPWTDYRAGRGRILERFLARPAIYSTKQMREQYEAPARENLRRELLSLRE